MTTNKRFETNVMKYLNKRDINDSSKKTHFSRLNKIREGTQLATTSPVELFIKNHKKVISFIESYDKSSTKKSYYISVFSLLQSGIGKSKSNEKVVNLYKEKMEGFRDINNEEREDNRLKEEERVKWINFNQLDKVYKQKEGEIKSIFKTKSLYVSHRPNIKTQRNINRYLNLLVERVILYLYFNMPPKRTDWVGINMIYNPKFVIEKENTSNLLVFRKNDCVLVINKYKNVNKLGKYVEVLKQKDCKFLKEWFNFLSGWYNGRQSFPVIFNVDSKGGIKTYTPNAFSNKFKRITKEYINEGIGINMARRIWETNLVKSDKYKDMTNLEKRIEHNKLLHSTATAQEYVRV